MDFDYQLETRARQAEQTPEITSLLIAYQNAFSNGQDYNWSLEHRQLFRSAEDALRNHLNNL